jgi:hypothetical protein
MTKLQIARDKANERGSDVLVENNTALMLNILYPPLKAAFNGKMGEMEVAKQKQFEQVTPITEYKTLIRDNLITYLYPFTARASVQASTAGNYDLARSLDHPITYLSKTTDDELIGRATDLKNIIAANLDILTVIPPDEIPVMEANIEAFNAAKDKPQDEIKDKKSLGTDPIPGLLDDIDGIKHDIGKLLASDFPAIYPVWKARIKVGTPMGIRNTSLIIRYYDASSDALLKKVKATIEIASDSLVKYSTIKGYARFFSLDTGTYMLTSEHPNFITDIMPNIGIINTQIVKIDVRLTPKILSGILDLTVFDKLTGNPISGAKLTIPALNFQGTTSSSGKLLKNELAAGSYEAYLTCDTYKRLDFTFTIETKQTTILQLYMEKEVV